jgi:glyoxylase-like metal-dependent hydrolase (beta-lactamase superfamily II)
VSAVTDMGGPAPVAPGRNSSAYRFRVGSVVCTAVSDGQAWFPAYPSYAPNAEESEVRGALERHGLDPDRHLLNVTALLVESGGRRVLVDAGAGGALGPGYGLLPGGLAAVGIGAEAVDVVHVTHGHLDHIGGLVGGDGSVTFPRARLSLAESEWRYWTDPDLDLSGLPLDPGFRAAFAETAARALLPYAGRVDTFNGRTGLAPGVVAEETGAHTPGHSIVRVGSGGRDLVVVGDLFHHDAFDVSHPHWCTAFDWRPADMPGVRRRLLDELADSRALAFAYHAPFPGVGRVVREGHGFSFRPQPWLVAGA